MIERITTDTIYAFSMHKFQMFQPSTFSQPLLQQQQQVLPTLGLENYNTGEFDSNPTSIQDFINSVQVNALATGLADNSSRLYNNVTHIGTYSINYIQTANTYDQVIYIPCENVYNPNDYNTIVEFWVCGICLNIIGVMGIIGNIISMIILSRPQMRSSINYLLIGLACCDTVLIITSLLLFGIPSVYPYTGHFFLYYNYIYPFISPVMFPVALISQTASIYMTFTVTLERYVAVCHPLKARALCTYGRAKIYVIVSVVFSILYNLPRFWEVVPIETSIPNSTVVLHCVRPSTLRQNHTYITVYILWCYFIVNYVVPFLTLTLLNCQIYRQVKRANRERQRLSCSEKREIGLATMLLCVVVVFFVFNFLALVLNVSEAFYNVIDHSLAKISNLLVTINSSCNFLIYVLFGEKFKRVFLLIFFNRHLNRDQPDLVHYESSISNNGDGTLNRRSSGRFSRHGTQRSTTTYLVTGSGNNSVNNSRFMKSSSMTGVVKIKRGRAPSPSPLVYYPALEVQRNSQI